MERERRGAEKLGEKLRRGILVGKRGGPTTPVRHSLFSLSSHSSHSHSRSIITEQQRLAFVPLARKLGASLWELLPMHHHRQVNGDPPPVRPRHGVLGDGGGDAQNDHRHRIHRDKGVVDLSRHFLADNNTSLTSDPDQPASASSLRRHLVASLMQRHRTAERRDQIHQPLSPASYGSSMEMTPTSSFDFRGRVGEPQYNPKTSTELIKVLNRIWSLEEQHASNMSLIKAMKNELDHTRAKVKELLRDRQSDRREIDGLAKRVAEEKAARKSKEQSVRDELEDERRLRKRSESLHRKLARELSEAKSSLSGAMNELERERDSRKLLEGLCDEFAAGIKDYEQEAHFLRQKSGDPGGGGDRSRLILHVSESWLDERIQSENESVLDRLRVEIETFLQAKAKQARKLPPTRERRNSMESVPLNETLSAPRDPDRNADEDDDVDSLGSGSHCFELEPGKDRTPSSSLQVKFEEKMARAATVEGGVRNRHLAETAGGPHVGPDNENAEASCSNDGFGWRNRPSPVRQWIVSKPDPESTDEPEFLGPKPGSGPRENRSLKAKLMEARSKGGRRSRLRGSKAT